MPTLKLTNTLTRKVEDFKPLDESNVRMYVCGVTPYDDPHIGNARPMVVFDVLYRLLRHLYGEDKVTYVRNFTDIDDKIIARANEVAEDPTALAQRFIDSFHADADALGCLRPNHEPRVSEPTVMQGIITFIGKLVEKGAAYPISDGVYLDITKIESLREHSEHYTYGQLSGKKIDELQSGARVDVNTEKRNPGDFALWKFAKPGEPSWPTPWGPNEGRGRPGWHIECSVMSEQLLGTRFDIHGGGEDLQFPHHENELAQSVSCHGHIHANTWLHNAFITVEGKKMSKSLGNFTTIKDALAKYSGAAIRLWLLQTHYRKPVDFSHEALQATESRLKNARTAIVRDRSGLSEEESERLSKGGHFDPDFSSIPSEFWQALSRDLDTSNALACIDRTENPIARASMFYALGIKLWPTATELLDKLNNEQQRLYDARATARTNRDWKESDRLRDELKALGILVEDSPSGTTWRRA